MAVRTVPPNAIRDKTGKKAVRPAPPYQFERFVAPLSVLSDIGLPIRPALLVTRRKHCANALLCGAYPCRNPFASTEAEGFSAFGKLYTILGRRWAEMQRICTSESNETCSGPSRSVRRVGRWLKICDHENLSPGSEVLFQRIIQDEARQYRSKVVTLHLKFPENLSNQPEPPLSATL